MKLNDSRVMRVIRPGNYTAWRRGLIGMLAHSDHGDRLYSRLLHSHQNTLTPGGEA